MALLGLLELEHFLIQRQAFRPEKTPTGTFVNTGSGAARIVFAKVELLFINNAGNKGATAKIEVDPKTGVVQRIAWSDGSVFTRKAAAVVESTRDAWLYKVDNKDGWFKKGTDKGRTRNGSKPR